MLFIQKPCPCCGADHGHSRWAVANCSVMRPLRCRQCGRFFHQSGLNVQLWSSFLLPTGIFFAVHWSAGLAAWLVEMVASPCTSTGKNRSS
ncbi:MAG: hypothetical protein QM740_14660 [Acidovorax sp.]